MTRTTPDRTTDTAARLRARYADAWHALARIPGVRGLGIGLVGDDRNAHGDSAIGWRVYVDTDCDRPMVPATVATFRTRVVPVAASAPCYGDGIEPTLKPGIRIQIRGSDPGTLGCFARLKSDPTKIVLLSNSHVLYSDSAELHGPGDGNAVGQPDVCCCWCCKCRVIAHNLHNAFHLVTVKSDVPAFDAETGSEIDAAIAVLNGERPFTNESEFYGMITGTPSAGQLGVKGGDRVEMVGFTSGHRTGTVLEFTPQAHYVRGGAAVPHELYPYSSSGRDVDDSFAGAQPSITDLLILPDADPKDPTRKMAFAQPGDSGAVIVNAARQVVGILHATVTLTPKNLQLLNGDLTHQLPQHAGVLGSACQIRPVLDALDIEIVNNMKSPAHTSGDALPLSEDERRHDREEQRALEQAFQNLTREIQSRALGREVLAAIDRHRPEVGRLLDRKAEVMLAWHRMEGPAYAAHILNSFRDHAYTIPGDVNGVTPPHLIARMAAVLRKHGSDALRATLDQYEPLAFEWIADTTSVWRVVERLRRLEIDEPPAIDCEVTHAR